MEIPFGVVIGGLKSSPITTLNALAVDSELLCNKLALGFADWYLTNTFKRAVLVYI